MFKEVWQLLQEYGWAAAFLFTAVSLLIHYVRKLWPIWSQRDKERTEKQDAKIKDELFSHQFFSNVKFKISSEVPLLDFNSDHTPVRNKLFKRLVEIRMRMSYDLAIDIITNDLEDMTSAQWSSYIISARSRAEEKFEEEALREGIPPIVVKKFLVWQHRTTTIFIDYVRDLAVSTVYSTNIARTNTLLYLMNLKLITIVGDAEKTLISLNGALSGIQFEGETIEDII